MSLSSTDKANRYFAYDLSALIDDNGGMSFGIPPVNDTQFGTSRACLIKISKVQLAPDTTGKKIDWYRPASNTVNYLPMGIVVESNLISRNYAHISNDRGDGITSTTGQNQSTDQFNALTQKVSIPIYSTTPEAIDYVSYDDQNSIFDNGLLCAMPFGQIVRFEFREGVRNTQDGGSKIIPVQGGADEAKTNGWMTVRLEIFVLDQ